VLGHEIGLSQRLAFAGKHPSQNRLGLERLLMQAGHLV
jgi:hypothetical protein